MLRLRCRRWPEPQCASESELWPYSAVGGFPPPVRKKTRWEAATMRTPVVILRSRRISYWRRLGLTIRCPWLASRPASRRIRHRAPPAMSRRSLPPRQARPRRGAASRRQERSSSRLIGQREDRHPCGPAVRLDNRVLHPTGDRDVLNATKHIGNDTATNRVAQMLVQQDLPARRVESQEVAFSITRENHSTSGRGDGSDHRGVGVVFPDDMTVVGIHGSDVPEPLIVRVLLPKPVRGSDEGFGRIVLEALGTAELDGRRPVDRRNEEEVEGRRIRRTIPVGAALRAWQESRSLGGHRRVDVLDPRDWRLEQHLAQVATQAVHIAVLACRCDHLPPGSGREENRARRHIPIMKVVL